MTSDGKSIGLALSGGGFRATLFGLGSLWRLNEIGLLGKLDRITSVSGGSILAGILAHRWKNLRFDQGTASNFFPEIVEPVREFCEQTIDVSAGLWGILTPFKTAGEFLADRYDQDLFHGAMLKGIPPAVTDQAPKFIFYATNMQTGRSFRFRQDMVADYYLGIAPSLDVPLAEVVAASSAFPPIFSPIILKTDPLVWQKPLLKDPDLLDALRRRIVLADGGVYDNMGLQSLVGTGSGKPQVDHILVSDAGAPFKIDVSPFEDDLLQLGRVRDILIEQTRAIRKNWLVSDFKAGNKHGAYWGISTEIKDFQDSQALTTDNELTASLEHIATRLGGFKDEEQGHLINWGYALADAALRTYAGFHQGPSAEWPLPRWRLA
ncbi:MAG: patatin-like phospholipase family protein [Deltaproteobacteria bacterium]|nr:patatin-like phospholipase family protein [Deltaproteobacteria bacterium]